MGAALSPIRTDERLARRYRDLARLLARAVDPLVGPGRGHSLRVAFLSDMLARALGLDRGMAFYGGLLHDLGGHPPGAPAGALRDERRTAHAVRGAGLSRAFQTLRALEPIIAHHHDGIDASDRLSTVVSVVSFADALDGAMSRTPLKRRSTAMAVGLSFRDTGIAAAISDAGLDLLGRDPSILDTLYDERALFESLDRVLVPPPDIGDLDALEVTAELSWLLAREVDIKHRCAPGHSARVAFLSRSIASRLSIPDDPWDVICSALLHDLGTIAVPTSHASELSPSERSARKEATRRLVASIEGFEHLARASSAFLDAYDGSFQPDAPRAEAIPLIARVIAYADSFDNLCHGYAEGVGLGRDGAWAVLEKQLGRELDESLKSAAFEAIVAIADAPEDASDLFGFRKLFQAPEARRGDSDRASSPIALSHPFITVHLDAAGTIQGDAGGLSALTSSSAGALVEHVHLRCRSALKEALGVSRRGATTSTLHVASNGSRIEIVLTRSGDGLDAHVRAAPRLYQTMRELAFAHRNFLQTSEAVCYTDADARIVDINYAFTRMYGWRADEVIGRTPRILRSGLHPPELYRGMRASLADSTIGAWDGDIVNRTKTGAMVTVHLTINAIRDASGAIVGYVSNALDITARLRAEEALRDRERQLVAKNQELQQLNQFKSQIVAMTSHDLRAPLASMIMQLAQLREGVHALSPDVVRERLAAIEEIGHRLTHLTSDLLDLDKCESGKLELHCRRIHADGLLEAIAKSQSASGNAVTAFDREPSSQIGANIIVADPERLEQAITNLITNGLKFSPPGQAVELSCERVSLDRVCFSVTDLGPGIPKEALESVFDRYSQLTGASTRGSGFGLGLAIVRHIAELHGGRAWAESRPGGGTRFSIELPVTGPPAAPAPATVLLIGPPSEDLELAARVFTEAGAHVHRSEREAEAERRMMVEAPLLCLVDVRARAHVRDALFAAARASGTTLLALYHEDPPDDAPRWDGDHVSPLVELELVADLRRALTRRGVHRRTMSGQHIIVIHNQSPGTRP